MGLVSFVLPRTGKKGAPGHDDLATRDKRDPLARAQDGPQALEPAREDVHRELAAAFLLLDEERKAG